MTLGVLGIFFFIYTVEQFWRLFYPADLKSPVSPPPAHDHAHADAQHGSHGHDAHATHTPDPQHGGHGHDDHGGHGHEEEEEAAATRSPLLESLERVEGAILLKFILAVALSLWFGTRALSGMSHDGAEAMEWTTFLAAVLLLVSGSINMWRDANTAVGESHDSAEPHAGETSAPAEHPAAH
jgi:hypothetical protein